MTLTAYTTIRDMQIDIILCLDCLDNYAFHALLYPFVLSVIELMFEY